MGSVARLLQSLDGSIPLQVLDRAGRDPATDTHFHGLARSVMFNVEGLVAEGLEQRDRHGAFALLVAMSMLHGTQTPHSLFRQPPDMLVDVHAGANAATLDQTAGTPRHTGDGLDQTGQLPYAWLFSQAAPIHLERAAAVLVQRGLLKHAPACAELRATAAGG